MSEWKICKLTDIADVRDGTHDSPKEAVEGKHLVTSRHIKKGKIDTTKAYKISQDDFEQINKRSKVDKWDILFSMIGTVGEIALIDFQPDFAIKNVGLFKTGNETTSKWIYYYLQSKDARNEIGALIKGSTQEYIPLGDLRKFPVSFPSQPKQRAIISVLSSLDDKIDLLHRQNKTLEAMAETLYRQWFVEEAQDGWEEGPLKQYVDIGIGRTPPRKEHQWFSENPDDVKWISIKDLGNEGVYAFDTAEFLTHDAVDEFNIPVIPENTVVLSFKMTVGRVAITTERMLSNEAIAHFKFRPTTPFSVEYLYLFLKSFQYDLLGSTSSIVTAINSAMIKDMGVTIPDENSMERFDNVARKFFKKIRSNQNQIRTLEKLRDTLLPKLMSGEVRVAV